MDASHLLVIILSVTLSLFLICAIVVVVMVIMLIKKLQRAAQRLDDLTETIGHGAKVMGKRLGPAVASGVAGAALKYWRKNRKAKEARDE